MGGERYRRSQGSINPSIAWLRFEFITAQIDIEICLFDTRSALRVSPVLIASADMYRAIFKGLVV